MGWGEYINVFLGNTDIWITGVQSTQSNEKEWHGPRRAGSRMVSRS